VLDPRCRRGNGGQLSVEGQLVGIQHGADRPVADGMGGDPPASRG
jgi:hypothetical protein